MTPALSHDTWEGVWKVSLAWALERRMASLHCRWLEHLLLIVGLCYERDLEIDTWVRWWCGACGACLRKTAGHSSDWDSTQVFSLVSVVRSTHVPKAWVSLSTGAGSAAWDTLVVCKQVCQSHFIEYEQRFCQTLCPIFDSSPSEMYWKFSTMFSPTVQGPAVQWHFLSYWFDCCRFLGCTGLTTLNFM